MTALRKATAIFRAWIAIRPPSRSISTVSRNRIFDNGIQKPFGFVERGFATRCAAEYENDSVTSTENGPAVPRFTIFYNDVYEVKLPPNHRFPMEKYRRVRETVQTKIAALSDDERSSIHCDFCVSPLATFEELATTHSPTYISNFLTGNQTERELRNVGFPWSPALVKRTLSSVGGTVAAASTVCDLLRSHTSPPLWSAHVAGGTHHAFFSRGEGFCVFSDIAVAANVVLNRYPDVVQRVLIIDLDVHQGNGNAKLFEKDDRVYTFSMQCSSNYFSEKEASDLDIELPPNCDDGVYLSTLRHWLHKFYQERERYDIIFFQAGVDVLEEDRLGNMSLSAEGVRLRNEMVFELAWKAEKPLVITMGGGYPRQNWDPIIEGHAGVYFGAHRFLSRVGESTVASIRNDQ